MLAHVAWRHVARINRRDRASEKHQERWLWSLQMKGDLVIAVRADLIEVAIPGFARIDAELFARLARQQVPRTFHVLGREGLAIVPSDTLAQREG